MTHSPAEGARLAFAGGGTGGHLTPGLHLLERLIAEEASGRGARPADLLWFSSGRAVEARLLAGLEQRLRPCPVERVELTLEPPGGGAPSLARLARCVLPAALRARRALRAHASHSLLGLGGFTSLPAVLAARSLGLPVYLLEVNAVRGRATRWLSPLARRVFHAFPASLPARPGRRDLLSGAPLAPRFGPGTHRERARAQLGVAPERVLLAVLGGSQGAGGINTFLRLAAPALLEAGVEIVHQVGPGRLAEAAAPARGYRALEYVDDMPTLLAAADFVLSRGGAFTLSEVGAAALPAWVVPYPHHADRHQARNVEAFGEGFELVEERQLDAARAGELALLLGPEGEPRRARMRAALAALERRDASCCILVELGALPLEDIVAASSAAPGSDES